MTALDVVAGRADWAIEQGDALERLAALPAESVHCCITSPPYFGLRDYGTATWVGGDPDCDHLAGPLVSNRSTLRQDGREHTGPYTGEKAVTAGTPYRGACGRCGATRVDQQIGLEPTLDAYVVRLVAVFAAVKRVLRKDGTCWLNLGDSYATNPGNGRGGETPALGGNRGGGSPHRSASDKTGLTGVKPKDLIGVPWRVAFALQADGWWLRSAVTWCKANPMPESVTDRPTSATEMVFLLTRSARYAYDADAIREPHTDPKVVDGKFIGSSGVNRAGYEPNTQGWAEGGKGVVMKDREYNPAGRNKRNWWLLPSEPFPLAHFATMPTALVEPCILAGAPGKVCPACGAPWARVVTKGPPAPEPAHRNPVKRLEPGQAGNADAGNMGFRASRLSGQEMARWKAEHPDVTTGWTPGCAHGLAPIGGVVLDPFAGSGTVVLEALRHGRRGIGFDLSATYCDLARSRIVGDCPLFNAPDLHGEAAGC